MKSLKDIANTQLLLFSLLVLWASQAGAASDPFTQMMEEVARQSGNSYGGASHAAGYGFMDIITSRIAQHVLALLLGALIGAFFSDRFKKFRKIIVFLIVILCTLIATILSSVIGNIVFFFIGFSVAMALLAIKKKTIAKEKKKPVTFGSAEWADFEHLEDNKLIGKKGFLLGNYEEAETAYPVHYASDRHMLTIAPTRSGKGVSAVIPNLLTYEGSVVVIDPKGENAKITAPRRGAGNSKIEGLGQDIYILDPWGITGFKAACFNPIDWLMPEDEDINENAMILADAIITNQGNESFWDEEAKALLIGFLLHVAIDESEEGSRTLGRIRDIISFDKDELNQYLDSMLDSENAIVRGAAARTISKEEKLKSSVLASLQANTHFLDSPRMRQSLASSDFKFEDLKTQKITVYLVLPADRLETFGRWLRLIIQQALTVNARNIEIKPDKPILFLLDEMAALGKLSMVEQAYGLMAGFGMQLWGIIQDLSQLEKIYGKGWETFIGNSGVIQYFGSRDLKTAEYFSKMCGVTTVEKMSFSKSIAKAFSNTFGTSSQGQQSSSSSSVTQGNTYTDGIAWDVVQRNLAYPDELMVLRDDKQLIFIENFNPITGIKNKWYEDENLQKLGVNLFKEDQENKDTSLESPVGQGFTENEQSHEEQNHS